MSWVEVLPKYEPRFCALRWKTPEAFLAWTGILVNRHRHRDVEQVVDPETEQSYYLKKQHRVTWRERLRNAWDGFGWCATAVREAATLQALQRAGIGCPDVVALGEVGRQAFVLTRAETGMLELRELLTRMNCDHERVRLATSLGAELARIHHAGFDHPDLFAKHILVAATPGGFRFSFLDWQRARHRRNVSWAVRVRDLATLDATLHESLASDWLRARCLHAYLQAMAHGNVPPFRRLVRQIARMAGRLRRRRSIREIGQPLVPGSAQRFVPHAQGNLLVTQDCHEEYHGQLPAWLRRLPEIVASQTHQRVYIASDSSAEIFEVLQWPLCVGDERGFPKLAHLLFRLQRVGVPAPRLVAVGWSAPRAFLAMRVTATTPLADALSATSPARRRRLLAQAGWMVRQLHDAGLAPLAPRSWFNMLGVVSATDTLYLSDCNLSPRRNTRSAHGEFANDQRRLSPLEKLSFLRAYLHQRDDPDPRRWIEMHMPESTRSERRVAA